MRIIADTHCHTIASTHAYSTLLENIKAAKAMGLYAIAVTDHGPHMPGAPGAWYFENLRIIPERIEGVRVLKGVEANVIDEKGTLDISDKQAEFLEWVIASMHAPTFPLADDVDACTEAWMSVAKDPRVRAIGHSGTTRFRYDYERVIKELGRHGKAIEINNASFTIRSDSIQNCRTIAKLCMKHHVPVIVNSDAHVCLQVGHVEMAIALLEEISFPEELVVNSSEDRFKAFLGETYC